MHITVLDRQNVEEIQFDFTRNEDIIELLLVVDAIKRTGAHLGRLIMPYVPFGRQDRVANPGEAFSLKVFADLINNLGFVQVVITDPHSEVTPALFNNCKVIHQHEIFAPMLANQKDFVLVSPDGGALKKIYKLAEKVNCHSVIEFSKHRNVKTGEITGVQTPWIDLNAKDCVIVDDICDGGRTFVEIAKVLQRMKAGKITLMVTHGFFTQGLQVFDGLIDEIYTRKGRVK